MLSNVAWISLEFEPAIIDEAVKLPVPVLGLGKTVDSVAISIEPLLLNPGIAISTTKSSISLLVIGLIPKLV